MSLFSAEARRPRVTDLAGVLCCQGHVVSFARSAARLSVVVEEAWRARALAAALLERGIEPELGTSDEGHPLVRTAFRRDLTWLADYWTRGAVKAVPPNLPLDGAILRLWALAAGRQPDPADRAGNNHGGAIGGPLGRAPRTYLLGLDPRAPHTHDALAAALSRIGLPGTVIGTRGGGPCLRITGRRRLARLTELIGDPPCTAAEGHWIAGGALDGSVGGHRRT